MFKYVEAKEEELIKKIYRFRYHVLCEEFEIFKKEDYPDGLEFDKYDRSSIHLAALDQKGDVIACLRLIHHSPIGYPTEQEMEIKKNLSFIKPNEVGEISRIFIHSKYRDMCSTKLIIHSLKKEVCNKMIDLGIEYSYGALEKPFHRLLRMLKMPYEIVGEAQKYGGRIRYPAILSTKKLIEANPDFYELMEKKCVEEF